MKKYSYRENRKKKRDIRISRALQGLGMAIIFFLAGPLASMEDLTPFGLMCLSGLGFLLIGSIMEWMNG